jgi:hypothetical protein
LLSLEIMRAAAVRAEVHRDSNDSKQHTFNAMQ